MRETNRNNGEGMYVKVRSQYQVSVILNCFPAYFLRQDLTEPESHRFS